MPSVAHVWRAAFVGELTMTGLLKENLTAPYSREMKLKIEKTHEGVASWADPSIGHSCRECTFWGRKTFDRDNHGVLKPKRCYKRVAMQRGVLSDPVPHNAFACRMFERGDNRPPADRQLSAEGNRP